MSHLLMMQVKQRFEILSSCVGKICVIGLENMSLFVILVSYICRFWII